MFTSEPDPESGKAVAEVEEVVEFYPMSGDIDYLLRIVVPDIAPTTRSTIA